MGVLKRTRNRSRLQEFVCFRAPGSESICTESCIFQAPGNGGWKGGSNRVTFIELTCDITLINMRKDFVV